VREGVTPETASSAALLFAYLTCLGLHAAVAVHPRYLLPFLAGSIVVGAANTVWLATRLRARRLARLRGASTEGSGITAGSR